MNVIAKWAIRLNCKCPACKKHVDLLDYPDFWDGRGLRIGENETECSRNVEVVCPECDNEFTVCCEI
jgi:hypothetical protein